MSALDEIRLAESRRMLGLTPGDDLRACADDWLSRGVESPSLEILSASHDASAAESLRLLRAAAVELELTFATTQEARTHLVRASLPDLTSPEGVVGIAEISNGLTDEFTARLRRLFRRRV